MMITLYVEEPILENFIQFCNEKDAETNGHAIRRLWHLDRNVSAKEKLIEVSVTYSQYIWLADNE